MDLFAREKLGWFPTLRQPPGYSTFFKPRFLRIQWYPNFHMRRISFWNGLFDSDFFYDPAVLWRFRIFEAGLVTAMLSACQNKLSGLLHCEQNGPVMDAVARFDSPQYSWLSSVVTSWLQSDLQPISCQCIDKTACALWSDDIIFLSQYNGCLKISRIVPCMLVQNVFWQKCEL